MCANITMCLCVCVTSVIRCKCMRVCVFVKEKYLRHVCCVCDPVNDECVYVCVWCVCVCVCVSVCVCVYPLCTCVMCVMSYERQCVYSL